MSDRRLIEAYCDNCGDVRTHAVQPSDPGSCVCTQCSHAQQLMVPI